MKLGYILLVIFVFICLSGTGFAQSTNTKDESSEDTSTGKEVPTSTQNSESNQEDGITEESTTPETTTNSTLNVTKTVVTDPEGNNDNTVVIVVSVIGGVLAIACMIFAAKYFEICQ